jgi:hypothetical protein
MQTVRSSYSCNLNPLLCKVYSLPSSMLNTELYTSPPPHTHTHKKFSKQTTRKFEIRAEDWHKRETLAVYCFRIRVLCAWCVLGLASDIFTAPHQNTGNRRTLPSILAELSMQGIPIPRVICITSTSTPEPCFPFVFVCFTTLHQLKTSSKAE